MPIEYSVSDDGHCIHAVASEPVTSQEFVDYEIAHAIDGRIRVPVSELFEIRKNSLRNITREDILKVIERRKEIETPHTHHRCGIVVSFNDLHAWDIAKFYEGMSVLHSPEAVIVFGDGRIAKIWLGFEKHTDI
jgi:hypothetical protein